MTYINNPSVNKLSDSILLILFKVLNVAAQTLNFTWVIYWSIQLGSIGDVGIGFVGGYVLFHGLASIWSFLYIIEPANFKLRWFRIVSALCSVSMIVLTFYCGYLMLSESTYALSGLLFIFYIGFTETLVSISLLMCFLFEKTQEQERKIVVYKMAANNVEDIPRTQTILMI